MDGQPRRRINMGKSSGEHIAHAEQCPAELRCLATLRSAGDAGLMY